MTRFVRIVSVAALSLAIAITITLLASDPTHAQGGENDYVDVGLTLEVPRYIHGGVAHHLNISVVNNGSKTAYDVEVVVHVVYPENNSYIAASDVTAGTAHREGRSLRWTIPELGELQGEELVVDVWHKSANLGFDNSLYPHELFGQVTTSSFESNLHKRNNTSRVWSYPENPQDGSWQQVEGNYAVTVQVDEPSPSPGDTVNFTITALRERARAQIYRAPAIDLKVDIGLTGGLAVSGEATYAFGLLGRSNKPDSVVYSDGVFDIGTLNDDEDVSAYAVTLPVRVASNAAVNEQCLTATLTGNPPPGPGPFDDDISDNVAELCLGDQPPEPFDSGVVRTWTLYACKDGVADNMCDTADEVDVRVFATIEGSGEDRVLDNATALIHVKDVPGRVFDANSGSVTDGTTVSWQTATDPDPDFTGTREGVKVGLYREPVNDSIDDWTNYHPTFKVSGLDGGDPPGKLSIRSRSTGSALWALTSTNSWTDKRTNPFSLSSASSVVTVLLTEFEELGTYVVDFDVDLEHATIDDDSDGNKDVFSGTGRTIFHVGPIAELGVRDGSVSPHATADQVAFTVVGVNNRDEEAESAKIVVELPTGITGLTTVPANTGTFDGTVSPPMWTWDIHDLELADRRASKGLPEGEIVTLIVDGVIAGETATANVAYDPYEVCVASDGTTATATTKAACDDISGASWHSGTVFDTNRKNNTTTLIARRGGNAPGTPTLKAPSVHTPAIGYEWDEIDYIYGLPVKHYETEWSLDGVTGWTQLSEEIVGTKHVDTRVHTSGFRYYRVRAVNQAGVPGPWSAPMAATTGLVKADAPALTARASSSTAIQLTWTRPTGLSSPVTRYQLQVADGSSGPWTDVPDRLGPSALSYTYSPHALTGGTRKYFRIRALTDADASDWSRVAQATTLRASVPGAPRSVSAHAQGTDSVVVSWNAPSSDGGSPITRYEVHWRRSGGDWQLLGYTMDGYTYTLRHNVAEDFDPDSQNRFDGQTYHYRVRARNSSGDGPWSSTVSATTRTDVPDAPILSVKSKTSTETHLVWDQYFPNPESSNVYRYELQANFDGEERQDSWLLLTTLGSRDREYRDTSMDVGETVWYRIRAVAENGNSSWSNVVKVTTPQGPPGPPADVRAEPGDSNVIRLYWSLPYRDGGSRVWRYQVQASNADNPNTDYSPIATIYRFDDDKCDYVDDTEPERLHCRYSHGGLESDDTWHYRVRAANHQSGWGPFSDWVSAKVP